MSGTRRWSWQQSTFGELVAEFMGTMIIILFGGSIISFLYVLISGLLN